MAGLLKCARSYKFGPLNLAGMKMLTEGYNCFSNWTMNKFSPRFTSRSVSGFLGFVVPIGMHTPRMLRIASKSVQTDFRLCFFISRKRIGIYQYLMIIPSHSYYITVNNRTTFENHVYYMKNSKFFSFTIVFGNQNL